MEDKLYFYKAFCYNCVDGDTIDVNIDLGFNLSSQNTRIRLLHINTPEKNRKSSKKAGLEAKAFLEEQILNKEIYVHSTKWDHFGRVLADVWTLEGQSINTLLIEKGYAVALDPNDKKSK
jgi:micrococcal nuclease